MDTKEKILAAIGSYNPETKGRTFIIHTSEGRVDILKRLAKTLKGNYGNSPSSSTGEVKVNEFKIIAKPEKNSTTGGSGAGAYMTAIAESAQCYYCAAAWYGKDFSETSLRKTASYVKATNSVNEVIKVLPDHWIFSCKVTAARLKKEYGAKKYIFHRGSDIVNRITSNFLEANRKQHLFSNINKWSPADIYMVSAKAEGSSNFMFEDINGLNHFMMKMIKEKELIGVSLKQTKTGTLNKVNFNKERHAYKFVNATLGKRGFFDSKDAYIQYDEGEIQFRGFPLTWQGEVKGKTANHGKLSGGPIKSIVDAHSKEKMDSQSYVESSVKSKNTNFYKKFFKYYVGVIGKNMTEKSFIEQVKKQPLDWQVSKYLGTQLIYILQNTRNKQLIVSGMINYAKSSSEYSAPYVKVS